MPEAQWRTDFGVYRVNYILMVMRMAGFSLFFAGALFFFTGNEIKAETEPESGEPVARYHELRRLYTLWRQGLFGSRNVWEAALRDHCRQMIYREFRTEKDFYIVHSQGSLDKSVRARFSAANWLMVEGPVQSESLAALTQGESDILVTRWWREKNLVALSGKVVWFRITRNVYGPAVEIVLESITVHAD